MPTGCPVLWTKTLFSLHSFKFLQQIVSALGGRGGPALNQAPGGLQLTFPEDRKSGLRAVLEQVVREGHSKKTVFSRGLKEVGGVSQAPGGCGVWSVCRTQRGWSGVREKRPEEGWPVGRGSGGRSE